MRRALVALAGACAVLVAHQAMARGAPPVPPDGAWRPVEIEAAPYQLRGDIAADQDLQTGALIYRGGLELKSRDAGFGGFSGLVVDASGEMLLSVSDSGQWLQARLVYDVDGRLIGVADARMAAITDKDGVVLAGRAGDAESLDTTPDGRLLVSFERDDRIDLYRWSDDRLVFDSRLVDLQDADPLTHNKGVEAMASLDHGVLALGEAPFSSGAAGHVVTRSGLDYPVEYKPAGGFQPTGMARAGDTLFILERSYSPLRGVRARILKAGIPDRDDPVLRPTQLARFGVLYPVDNMEGLAARETEGGRVVLYAISDDNFSRRQKTILLQFEYDASARSVGPAGENLE